MAKKDDVAIGTWPTPERVVRVRVPATVAFDLGSMKKVTASILDRLGHSSCHSGWDIRFDLETNFRVDQKLNII
jgi:hypothetical protein